MLLSFLAAASWIPAVLGLGALLRLSPDQDLRMAVQGFGGLAVLSAAGVLVHFWAPVGPAVSWMLFATGSVAFVLELRASGRAITAPRSARLAAGVLVAAAFAQLPARQYDSGLYYLQAVAWMTEEPLVRGLANVHYRLGFNTSWFATAAATEHGFLAGKSSFYLGVLPVFFAGSAVWRAARSLLDGDRSFSTVFLVLGAGPVVLALESVGGLGQDQPVMLVTYLVFALCARVLTAPENAAGNLWSALSLAVWAATVKLSAAALPVFVLALAVLKRIGIARCVAPAALLVVPWAVRGVLLSGCVVFPVAATCIPGLSWGVTPALASDVVTIVREWARIPDSARASLASGTGWLLPWVQRFALRLSPLALTLMAGVATAGWRRPPGSRRAFIVLWSASIAGTIYWFISAPDVRFGLGYLFPLAFLPLAFGSSESDFLEAHARKAIMAVALGAAALCAAQFAFLPKPWEDSFALARWPEFPRSETTARITSSGLHVNVPVAGDQCWAAERPCTPGLLFTPALQFDGSAYRLIVPIRVDAAGLREPSD